MGYIYAFLSSIFFSMYAIPKKKANMKPHIYVFFMGISCLTISFILYIIFGNEEKIFDEWLLLSVLGGIIWFIASVLFFYSVDKIGVARASEFKSLQGPIGSILMLFVLSEFLSLNVYLLLLAIVFIFISAFLLVIKEDSQNKIKLRDILIAIFSALFYALTGFIRKIVTAEGFVYIQQVYTSLGLVLVSSLYMLYKEKSLVKEGAKYKYHFPLLSGVFYYFASYFMLLAYENVEGSIAFPIIQLNSIWACLIGILIFKEIDYKKYYKRLLLGLLFASTGIVLLVICN